ncbi:hypothetical protein QTA57_18105 [Fontisubflavum oceani]|uniref:hypothetical protein n=1 Tax=Fontisubflavum oceani TaxID=2978973 RepID=UPI0025B2D120|nr:hypothetical protein [Fontisubflavum oceani]WJY21610.1 hypothetical protein QTA57_18105 [Fontisubflavum oceani]
MTPVQKRIVRLSIAVVALGLILDGGLTHLTARTHGDAPFDLVFEGERYLVWRGGDPAPADAAVALPDPEGSFGLTERYTLPDGTEVSCRFITTRSWCGQGWAVAYATP